MASLEGAWAPGEAQPPSGRQTALGFALALVVATVGLTALFWLSLEEAAARGEFNPLVYELAALVVGASFLAALLPIWWSRGRTALQLIGFRRASPRAILEWTLAGLSIYAVVIAAALAYRSANGPLDGSFAATLSAVETSIRQSGALVIYGALFGAAAEAAMTIALLGVLLPWMRRRLSLIASATVQGLVLAALLVWYNPPAAIHVGALTFLAVVARERTRSIWPPMMMNIVYCAADNVVYYADLGL